MHELLEVRARQLLGAVQDVRDPQLLEGVEVLGVFSCADADVRAHQRRTRPGTQPNEENRGERSCLDITGSLSYWPGW